MRQTPKNSADLEAFGARVGDIYECAIDPTGWPKALEGIRDAVGGDAVWIAVHYPNQVRSIYQIEIGTDPDWQRRLREHYVAASPFIGLTHHLDVGDVIAVGDVIDYAEFRTGRFYQEWAAPQGWPDIIMAVAAKEPDRFSWLGICLTDRATIAQKQMVAAFLPHIERALRISDLLEMRTTQAADLTAAVEELSSGMVLVDGALGVHGMNPAALRLIGTVRGLAIETNRLLLSASGPGAALAEAIAACAEGRMDRGGASILFDRTDHSLGLVAHVLPLARPHDTARRKSIAALFLTDPSQPGRPPLDDFVRRYGLTPSETRVLMGIVDGRSPRAIAAAQGVGLPTVRTHLSRLYDKTGTTGQTDVVRLVTSLTRSL
jgi:DNA-binding CsgD family transcriptional regulator